MFASHTVSKMPIMHSVTLKDSPSLPARLLAHPLPRSHPSKLHSPLSPHSPL